MDSGPAGRPEALPLLSRSAAACSRVLVVRFGTFHLFVFYVTPDTAPRLTNKMTDECASVGPVPMHRPTCVAWSGRELNHKILINDEAPPVAKPAGPTECRLEVQFAIGSRKLPRQNDRFKFVKMPKRLP